MLGSEVARGSSAGRAQSLAVKRRALQSKAGLPALLSLLVASALGGCAGSSDWDTQVSRASDPMFPESKWGVKASQRVASSEARDVPKGGGVYKVGQPYKVGDKWYNPREQPGYDRVGIASWYGSDFHARKTANGEVYDMHALTAAHPTLPMPSYAYVTNLANNRTILVRINDRGPYVKDRLIDLSKASADALGLKGGGTGRVRVRYAGPAPLNGDDSRERQFLASGAGNGPSVPFAYNAPAQPGWGPANVVRAPEPRPNQVAGYQRPWVPVDPYAAGGADQGAGGGWGQSAAPAPASAYGEPDTSGQGWGAAMPADPNSAWSPSGYRASIATNR